MHCIINQLVVKISGVGIIFLLFFLVCLKINFLQASEEFLYPIMSFKMEKKKKWQKVKFCTSRLHSFDSICLDDDDMPTRE